MVKDHGADQRSPYGKVGRPHLGNDTSATTLSWAGFVLATLPRFWVSCYARTAR